MAQPLPSLLMQLFYCTQNEILLNKDVLYRPDDHFGQNCTCAFFSLGQANTCSPKNKKVSPTANLFAGKDILRGSNWSEQTANMCCFGWIPLQSESKAWWITSWPSCCFLLLPWVRSLRCVYLKLCCRRKFWTSSTWSSSCWKHAVKQEQNALQRVVQTIPLRCEGYCEGYEIWGCFCKNSNFAHFP